jgi:RNase H-fold protein (predicted Holliday junction resolvase)
VEYEGEKLGKLIGEQLPAIHIAYQDEMFTTKMAQANLIERGEKHVGRHDDAEAARIILQSYMDKETDIGE